MSPISTNPSVRRTPKMRRRARPQSIMMPPVDCNPGFLHRHCLYARLLDPCGTAGFFSAVPLFRIVFERRLAMIASSWCKYFGKRLYFAWDEIDRRLEVGK